MSQITTHILDTAEGRPAEGVSLALQAWQNEAWSDLGAGVTNSDGRVVGLLADDVVLPAGRYRMFFETAAYFQGQNKTVFYPYVEVVFEIDVSGEHYHIPLLLAPFGYSTYRGS